SAFPEPLRSEFRTGLRKYIELVISDDWPVLRVGHQDTNRPMLASRQLNKLWSDLGAKIATAPLGGNTMTNLNTISTERAHRFALSREAVSDPLWLLLGVGTIVNISLAMLTSIK